MKRWIHCIALLNADIVFSTAQTYNFSHPTNSPPSAILSAAVNVVPFAESSDSDDVWSAANNHDNDDSLDNGSDDESIDSTDESGDTTLGPGSTISTIESTYKNWVGPSLGGASDTACYREAHIAKTCPLEFDIHHDICWAECPISYPIECGMECIRQNDDCGLEVVTKVSVVAQSAFSLATFGLYGEFKLMAKGVKTAYKCGKEMMNLVKQLTKFVRTIKVSHPHSTEKYLETVLYQTDNVVFDLPVTICTCLGLHVSETVRTADRITNTVKLFVREGVSNDAIIASWTSFKAFMKRITLEEPIESLDESDISSLQSALKSNSTCGYNMKRLLDRTWMAVANLRKQNPDISEADVRVEMSKSNLVLYEIPTVTNNWDGRVDR